MTEQTSPANARPASRGGPFAFPPTEPYEVSRVKIAEFADAIGDPDPLYRDAEAARAAGHADVIAPPTFAVAVRAGEFGRRIFGTDGLGIDPAHVIHVEEAYTHRRPLRAGVRVTVRVTVESARPMRGDEILTLRTDLRDAAASDDEPISAVRTVLLVRGGRPAAPPGSERPGGGCKRHPRTRPRAESEDGWRSTVITWGGRSRPPSRTR